MMVRMIRAALLWLSLTLAALPAAAQDTAAAAPLDAPSANDLHEFTRLLADPRIQGWLTAQADTAEATADDNGATFREEAEAVLTGIRARIGDLGQAWRSFPSAPAFILERWQTKVTPAQQVRGLTFVMIFLFVGAGLEWLYRQYTNPVKLRIELQHVSTVRERVTAATLRSLITLTGLAIFAVGSIGTFAAFSWPPTLETLVLNLLVVVFGVRAIRALLVLFLAPSVEELRLLPLSNPVAKFLSKLLLCLAGFFVLAASMADVFGRITGSGGQSPQALGVSLALATLALVLTLAAVIYGFGKITTVLDLPRSRAQRLWRVYLCVLAVLVYAALVLALPALMWSFALLGLLVPGLRLLRLWVDDSFDRAKAEVIRIEAPDPADLTEIEASEAAAEPIADLHDEDVDAPLPDHPYESYRPLAQRLVRFVALFAIGAVLAMVWDLRVFERAATPTFSGRALRVLIDSAVALLLADLVWVWASSAIDRRLAAYRPPEPGTAPGPEARMATLLPLLRVTLMVTLLVMVAMSVLSSLGVNIAPILAGAGVLGIAIGFGAQSLVKDVVSGIFFLVDDAFRVGEYVEIDQLRGTVEKISIRSLQIRHHRGAVHTLPFGELRHLTNHSRDWVIMKLEFRVPFETDLKLVKKLIKKIGAEMLENEFYGHSIIETLKSQGVRRMEEFNMVVGVKFMTRPGEQWLVRRDAYQMVRDAFEANGIRMAERNVKVEVAGSENMTEEERTAVAAAAQQATETQLGPKAPIPDEP
ncbi:mechanosensitive ion channel family protein [Sulfitobacter mediterraneus]|uniref:mechanosensitive ion channel family protein n=1 Tax=Sulfitobacter mediterraneus TaxID=83219 RepID=UPI00193AAC3C|nr:mechanosensitive ion channel family protein [Sulfitobacter mediterraneus]MBM1556974.1 mechanosensitive ion channel family protein [Sulfitobacter mediterraneus]MBM1569159.1 mechanosensitive ion channel family protein [Sulfitobacter mediterraneus]MBM1572586.1 mechanosensitive ion channel family protein [Sulfitobacter mediterraneus]MBM1576749.1 mechanosensitive ion channel family protein [Sulfitobacter mediterraneus]MBM1579932.1 mechanosensitive ion channel family protein [Sulfitobacter medite